MNRIGRARFTHLLVATGALLILGSRPGHGDVTQAEVITAAELESSLRAQLESREFADVAVQAENWIAQTETVDGRYEIALAQPLVLLGDARMGLKDPVGALEAYDRAKHIVRLSDGIQGTQQLDILYREVAAFSALGEWTAANGRHELAYDISRRAYGPDDLRHLRDAYRLIQWYKYHHKNLAALVVLEQLIDTVREHDQKEPLIRLLREQAGLWRQSRFGRRKAGRGHFAAWPPGVRRPPHWQEFFPFREGRDALGEIVALREESSDSSDDELATALLEYADWHLLFGDYATSVRHYRRVWQLLDENPDRRASIFEEPKPLFLPLPRNPGIRRTRLGGSHDGIVELALTVTHRGKVIGRKTVHVEPRTIMEHRVRMAARKARYRPAFRDGNPVKIKGHPLEFTYTY